MTLLVNSSSASFRNMTSWETFNKVPFSEEKGDSGIDSGSEDVLNLDESLCQRIVSQVELYFSDKNLSQDAFLLKHVKKNKEGYVNLKLVTSLRKVKTLTKDWKLVAHAIEKFSQVLSINEEGTKVRRVTSFSGTSTSDKSRLSRLILVTDLPATQCQIEHIKQSLSSYGKMKKVDIFTDVIPSECQQRPELGVRLPLALVEFESQQQAEKAVKNFASSNQINWRESMRVTLLSKIDNSCKRPTLLRQRSKTTSDVERKKEESLIVNKGKRRSTSLNIKLAPLTGLWRDHVILRQPRGPDGTKGFLKKILS